MHVLLLLLALLACSPLASAHPTDLRVLHFNAWILRMPPGFDIADDIEARVKLMPDAIAATGADVVCIQENWDKEIRMKLVRELAKRGYRYAAFREKAGRYEYVKQRMGNGLLIVSKLMLDPNIFQYRFTEPTRIGEFFLIKGAIKTRVRLPDMRWIDLYNAHLGAVTFDSKAMAYDPEELAKKMKQTEELAAFIRHTRTSKLMILSVDNNTHYEDFEGATRLEGVIVPEYRLMTRKEPRGLGLVDTYRAVHGFEEPPVYTYDRQRNAYAKDSYFKGLPSEVEDYIFVSRSPSIEVLGSEVVFTEQLPQPGPKHLSDHYGVVTTLRIEGR